MDIEEILRKIIASGNLTPTVHLSLNSENRVEVTIPELPGIPERYTVFGHNVIEAPGPSTQRVSVEGADFFRSRK